MVSWSTRRQVFYVGGALAVFLFVLALPVFFVTYTAPSCTDRKQNQGELGVDCGGPCAVLCKANALDLIIRWQRAFKVKEGVYNAVAYIENPNLDSGIDAISYTFKLYDTNNILIYERSGRTFVPPKKVFGIFESNLVTGERIPARTFFEFTSVPVWNRNYKPEPLLLLSGALLSEDATSPRLTASLENKGITPVYSTEVVAVVYDAADNALAASRTVVDSLTSGGMASLVFTWPQAFASPANRTELLYRVLK